MDRRGFLGAMAALAGTSASAQSPDDDEATAVFGGRMAVPVYIDDTGPYRFIVDSAANASLIADDLAASLALPSAGEFYVNTLVARERMASVRPRVLHTGVLTASGPRLALASRSGLSGVDGLLGSDLLHDLKLVLHFRGRARASIRRSAKEHAAFLDPPRPSTRLIDGGQEERGGPISIQVRVNGVLGRAILDTGAETTVVNRAMADTGARPVFLSDGSRRSDLSSPSGLSATGELMTLPVLEFAGVSLQQVPVVVGDFHVFDFWGLRDEPTMLMGVDILGLFRTVSIDLGREEVVLEV